MASPPDAFWATRDSLKTKAITRIYIWGVLRDDTVRPEWPMRGEVLGRAVAKGGQVGPCPPSLLNLGEGQSSQTTILGKEPRHPSRTQPHNRNVKTPDLAA